MLSTMKTRIDTLRNSFAFWKSSRQFHAFLGQVGALSKPVDTKKRVVVVPSWLLQPLPWSMITIACLLRNSGKNATLLWDDLAFGPQSAASALERSIIGSILKHLPVGLSFQKLSDYLANAPASSSISDRDIERLAELNTVWWFRGENLPAKGKIYRDIVNSSLRRNSSAFKNFLEQAKPEHVIIPGGLYGSSGVMFALCMQQSISITTLDHGFGFMQSSTNGLATYLADIPRAFTQLKATADRTVMIKLAKEEFSRRSRGVDMFASQATPMSMAGVTKATIGVLMPLNQSFDSAALGRHKIFKNQLDWVLQTVRWVLEETNEIVAVRQHPCERVKANQTIDDYRSVLKKTFGDHPRLRFVAAEDTVNTYDLIFQSKVVCPYVSTVGIEATALGIPVVSEGNSYYADMGFIHSRADRDSYFQTLRDAMAGKLSVTAAQQDDAWICYYITQCCAIYVTDFTPMPGDFSRWISKNFATLSQQRDVADAISSIESGEPLSIKRHFQLQSKLATSPA